MSNNHYVNVTANVYDESGGNVFAVAFVEAPSNTSDVLSFGHLTLIGELTGGTETTVSGNLNKAYANVEDSLGGPVVGGQDYKVYLVLRDTLDNQNSELAGEGNVVIDLTEVTADTATVAAVPSDAPNVEYSSVEFHRDSLDVFRTGYTVRPQASWCTAKHIAVRRSATGTPGGSVFNTETIHPELTRVYDSDYSGSSNVTDFYTDTTTQESGNVPVIGETYDIWTLVTDDAFRRSHIEKSFEGMRAGTNPSVSDTSMDSRAGSDPSSLVTVGAYNSSGKTVSVTVSNTVVTRVAASGEPFAPVDPSAWTLVSSTGNYNVPVQGTVTSFVYVFTESSTERYRTLKNSST